MAQYSGRTEKGVTAQTLPPTEKLPPRPPLKPANKPAKPGTAQAPECAWTGQRLVTVLLRDDVLAARGFLEFYSSFKCPTAHLGQAFGCAIPAVGGEADAVDRQVSACWKDPDYTAEKPAAPAAKGKPEKTEKPAGSEANRPAGREPGAN